MMYLHEELFNIKEKAWIGRKVQNHLNNLLDDNHQINRFNLIVFPRLKKLWATELIRIMNKVRNEMENDSGFKREQAMIEERYDEEMKELVERWKAQNMKKIVLENLESH